MIQAIGGPKAAEVRGGVGGVALVELGFQTAGGFEGLLLAAEPGGQDEGADYADGNVGCHPELGARAALAGGVARGKEESEFAHAISEKGEEAGADEPLELGVVGVGDEAVAADQDDGEGEDGEREEDVVERQDGVDETGHLLVEGHLLDVWAPEAEFELEGRVDCADCLYARQCWESSNVLGNTDPSRALLQMTAEAVGNGAELERLVDIGHFPTTAKHLRGGRNVFSEGSLGKIANLFQGVSSEDVP